MVGPLLRQRDRPVLPSSRQAGEFATMLDDSLPSRTAKTFLCGDCRSRRSLVCRLARETGGPGVAYKCDLGPSRVSILMSVLCHRQEGA